MPTPQETASRANRGPAAGPSNRRALIAAAREVYAESGLSAPFSQVAKRAGVGQGSLYRHFPDRTVDDFLDLVADQVIVSTAFVELLTDGPDATRVVGLGERYRDVVTRLLERQQEAGEAASVELEDVLLATEMLAFVLARTPPERRADVAVRARRLLRGAFRTSQID